MEVKSLNNNGQKMRTVAITLTIPDGEIHRSDYKSFEEFKQAVLSSPHKTVIPVFEDENEFRNAKDAIEEPNPYDEDEEKGMSEELENEEEDMFDELKYEDGSYRDVEARLEGVYSLKESDRTPTDCIISFEGHLRAFDAIYDFRHMISEKIRYFHETLQIFQTHAPNALPKFLEKWNFHLAENLQNVGRSLTSIRMCVSTLENC